MSSGAQYQNEYPDFGVAVSFAFVPHAYEPDPATFFAPAFPAARVTLNFDFAQRAKSFVSFANFVFAVTFVPPVFFVYQADIV